jgi:plastocyanin
MSPTDTELEPRLTDALRAKAAQVPESAEAFDPMVVMTLDFDGPRRPRFAALAVAVAAAVVVVIVGIFIAFGADGDQTSQQPAAPPQAPVAHIQVDALPSLSFQAKEFTTRPGLNEIEYVDFGGSHTLVFADRSPDDFRLSVPVGTSVGTIDLEAGRDYTIYCTIPGHRAAGMEAVIHVTDDPPSTTTSPTVASSTSTTPSTATPSTSPSTTTTTLAPVTPETSSTP